MYSSNYPTNMSDNKFDNYFRDRLQEENSPVPADMWQRIHDERRRKRTFFIIWWLIAPAIVLTGLYIGYRSLTSVATRSGQIIPSGQTTPPTLSARSSQTSTTSSTQSGQTLSPAQTISSSLSNQPNHITPSTSSTRSNQSTPSNLITPSPLPTPSQPNHTNPSQSLNTHLKISPITLHIQREPANFDRRPPLLVNKVNPNNKKQPTPTSKWYLDAYASPDWLLNHDGRLSYTAGFRLGRTLGPHFTGTIGIQCSRIRESGTTTDTMRIPYKLDLKTLDIPLLIGYKISFGRTVATITSGVIFNIHSTGYLYRTNNGLSLYLGLNYAEPVNNKLSLFAEPYIRYRLSNMTDYPYFLLKKIHVAGLSLGLRYNF